MTVTSLLEIPPFLRSGGGRLGTTPDASARVLPGTPCAQTGRVTYQAQRRPGRPGLNESEMHLMAGGARAPKGVWRSAGFFGPRSRLYMGGGDPGPTASPRSRSA